MTAPTSDAPSAAHSSQPPEQSVGQQPAPGSPSPTDNPVPAEPAGAHRWLIIVAIVLTGLTMRIAVSSVGAVLTDLEHGLHASSGIAGLITTLPVIAFATIGFAGSRLAQRVGEHRMVVLALLITTAGLLFRAVSAEVWTFAVLSMLALTGGAVANVLMPALVKRHFPQQIGLLTAVYTTSLAVGTTVAAGTTVPIANAGGSWRFGIGSWALLTAVALLPWLPTLRADRRRPGSHPARVPISRLARTKLAWALVLMFAFQSFQAYIAFGWFTDFFRHNHLSATEAGILVAFFSGLSIPVSMVIPTLAVRGQRRLVVGLSVASIACYLGMFAAPVGGAWVWMLFGGIGSGMFPLTLTMIGLRSRDIATTAALSGFVQGAGYLLAGTGPLLVGVLLGFSDNWTGPLTLLLVAAILSAAGGWYASRPRYVEDELSTVRPIRPR